MLGKAHRQGAEHGKATLVGVPRLEPARLECERLVGAALDALERFGAGAEVLRQAARFTAARRT